MDISINMIIEVIWGQKFKLYEVVKDGVVIETCTFSIYMLIKKYQDGGYNILNLKELEGELK